jgi:hypothetical protein
MGVVVKRISDWVLLTVPSGIGVCVCVCVCARVCAHVCVCTGWAGEGWCGITDPSYLVSEMSGDLDI